MLNIVKTRRFKKDWKKWKSGGTFDENLFYKIVLDLADGKSLDLKYRDHSLIGDMKHCRECHLKPDLLIVYEVTNTELVLTRIGRHSELFG